MSWQVITMIIALVLYLIWLLIFNYTFVKEKKSDDYVQFKVTRGYTIFCILTILVPIINIITSIFFPAFYFLRIRGGEDWYDVKIQGKNDLFTKIIRAIVGWLSSPLIKCSLFILLFYSCCPLNVNHSEGNSADCISIEWRHNTENCNGHFIIIERIDFKINDHDMWLFKENQGSVLNIMHSPECSKCNDSPKTETKTSDYWGW